MDYKKMLRDIAEHINKNSEDNFNNMRTVNGQTEDRVKMAMNPNLQGPKLPNITDDEKKYYGNLGAAVGGTLAGPAEEVAQEVAEEASPEVNQFVKNYRDKLLEGQPIKDPISPNADNVLTKVSGSSNPEIVNQMSQKVTDVNGPRDLVNNEIFPIKSLAKYNGGIIKRFKNLKNKLK